MFGKEFQVLGAVQWKARPKKVVLWKSCDKINDGNMYFGDKHILR